MPVAIMAAIGVLGAGCAWRPDAPRGFASPFPGERAGALTEPALLDDPATIPERIELLDSDDPLVRMLAIESLERMTGVTHGYRHGDDPLARSRAVDRWVAWYVREHRAGGGAEAEQP